MVPSPTPLAAMMQTLHPDTPDVTLATTLTTLGRLSADAVNCFYLQQAGVVRAMCTLLQHRKLAEPMTYDACRVLAGQARNCNMLEMARCNAAATMTMLMHCEEDDDECAASDVDGDECCGVSSRIATVIAGALADMAYEQLGKRLVVQVRVWVAISIISGCHFEWMSSNQCTPPSPGWCYSPPAAHGIVCPLHPLPHGCTPCSSSSGI